MTTAKGEPMSLEVEQIIINTSDKLVFGAAFCAWLSNVDWVAAASISAAIVSIAVNLYYRMKKDKRERAWHEARMSGKPFPRNARGGGEDD